MFDLSNGAIVRTLIPTADLSDSLAIQARTWDPNAEYVQPSIANQLYASDPSIASLRELVQQQFGAGLFKSDSEISVISQINTYKRRKIVPPGPPTIIGVGMGLLTYSLLDGALKSFHWAEYTDHGLTWPQMYEMYGLDKGSRVALCLRDHDAFRRAHYDSAYALGLYSTEGVFERHLCTVPVECQVAGMQYNFQRDLLTQVPSGDLYFVYGFVPKVFHLGTSEQFALKLPANNSRFLDAIRADPKVLPQLLKFDTLPSVVPLMVWALASTSGGNLMVTSRLLHPHGFNEWIVQEYSVKGELLQEARLEASAALEECQDLRYSSTLNQVIGFFRTKDHGWELRRYDF